MRFLILLCRLLFAAAAFAAAFLAFWHLGPMGIIVTLIIGAASSAWVFVVHDWKGLLASVNVAAGSLVGVIFAGIVVSSALANRYNVTEYVREFAVLAIGAVLGALLFSWASKR
jgi:hypothetical protein